MGEKMEVYSINAHFRSFMNIESFQIGDKYALSCIRWKETLEVFLQEVVFSFSPIFPMIGWLSLKASQNRTLGWAGGISKEAFNNLPKIESFSLAKASYKCLQCIPMEFNTSTDMQYLKTMSYFVLQSTFPKKKALHNNQMFPHPCFLRGEDRKAMCVISLTEKECSQLSLRPSLDLLPIETMLMMLIQFKCEHGKILSYSSCQCVHFYEQLYKEGKFYVKTICFRENKVCLSLQ